MKKVVTFRIESGLLERARHAAVAENRTLTNFVETALSARIGQLGSGRAEKPYFEVGRAEADHG